MADEWRTIRLGEVAQINPDAIDLAWPYSNIQYIDISSVGVGQIQTPPQRMELSDAPSRAKRLVRGGDTVLSTVRPNRRSMFFASEPADDWVVSTGFAVLRPDTRLVHPRFLYACVFNQAFTEYLITREKGAAYPAVSPEDIANAEIPYPPLKDQQAIACILGALDDNIELNRRMNQTLEAIAQAIFKSWFVDAIRNGLPEGWQYGTLRDAIAIHDSKRIPLSGRQRAERQGKYPYYGAASVMDYVDDFLFDGVYVLIGEDGSVVNDDDSPVLQYVWGKFWVNNHAHVLTGQNGISVEHLFLFLQTVNIRPFITGAVQPKLNQGNLCRIPFTLPPESVNQGFARLVEPLFARIRANDEQSSTLAALRDALLPKLISGELRVPDAERIVERCA